MEKNNMTGQVINALLVEDSPADADAILERIDKDSGIIFTLVTTLHDAMEALNFEPVPDVIVLDLGLPDSQGIGGVEALVKKRENVPIVVLTGLDDEDIGEAALRSGADDYLVKGTDFSTQGEVVRRAIKYAVERSAFRKELVAAKQRAIASDRAKFEFLTNMSHELRTPMNAVLGFAQLLQYDPTHKLTDVQLSHVTSIIDGGEHLLTLINQILDLAKIESDHVSISLEHVDVVEIVSECVAFSLPLGRKRNIEIINNVSDKEIPELRTDRIRFKQALMNLLSNAIKYNKDGGKVTINCYETADQFVRISVADDGRGLSKAECEKIFDVFYQVNSNPLLSREGTGIGLPVTQMLIDRLSGRIGVDSSPGNGSVFWFELPIVSNASVVIWGDHLRIGVEAIDEDHKKLISLLNKLANLDLADNQIEYVVKELLLYTVFHFEREEAVMEACGYPGLELQKKQHREMHRKIKELAAKWRKDRDVESEARLQRFLKEWLVDHILHDDMKMASYVGGRSEAIKRALADIDKKEYEQ